MVHQIWHFADSESGGISSLGINVKAFIFQLVAFLLVLFILSKYVFPKLVRTLEDRREVLEKSLKQARKTELTLQSAEEKAAKILHVARTEADEALAEAKTEAKNIVAAAEVAAETQSQRILAESQTTLAQEHDRLHDQLKGELVELVAAATEKVMGEKLDERKDFQYIEKTVKGLSK